MCETSQMTGFSLFSGFYSVFYLIAAGPVGTVDKHVFRWLIQAACGNHQEKAAAGLRYRFPQLRQFQQASPIPCFFLFASFSFFVEIATARHDC